MNDIISPEGYKYYIPPETKHPFYGDSTPGTSADGIVTNVSVTNENGVYTIKQTKTDSDAETGESTTDAGAIDVPQIDTSNVLAEISDSIVETKTGNYQNDFHTIKETEYNGVQNDVGSFYIARNQHTNMQIQQNGNIQVNFVNQNGAHGDITLPTGEVFARTREVNFHYPYKGYKTGKRLSAKITIRLSLGIYNYTCNNIPYWLGPDNRIMFIVPCSQNSYIVLGIETISYSHNYYLVGKTPNLLTVTISDLKFYGNEFTETKATGDLPAKDDTAVYIYKLTVNAGDYNTQTVLILKNGIYDSKTIKINELPDLVLKVTSAGSDGITVYSCNNSPDDIKISATCEKVCEVVTG